MESIIHSIVTPMQATVVATIFTFYRGIILTLAPNRSSKTFGSASNISPINKEMLRRAGIGLLAIAIRVYCVVLNDFGHRLASVINQSMWTAKLLETLLNLEENNAVEPIDAIVLFTMLVGTYVAIYKEEYIYTVLKVDGALGLCSGTLLFLFPNQFVKNKLEATKTDALTHIYVNTHGMALVLTGSYLTSVGFGMDAQNAFGYNALLASVLQLVKVFVIEDIENVKDIDSKKRKTQFCIRSCIFALLALIILI
ncbi:predicted protein [Chaetoceros tenuissimus]|uniref:Uncharacterized protein n=1 Tax=Chaetoceros tenuissimus TaxID=426638 RepID=A0AAD3CZZ9_9STRA|nr:predicted protein [Chaetoceros tenuissimus]